MRQTNHTWWRFIDDIFMIWTHTGNDLYNFIFYFNNLHPTAIPLSNSLRPIHLHLSLFPNVQVSLNRFGVVETDGTRSTLQQTIYRRDKRRLKDRFNEHRRPVYRPTPNSRPTAFSDHFLSDNHTPNDIELIPLELLHSSRDAIRKAREAHLIERG